MDTVNRQFLIKIKSLENFFFPPCRKLYDTKQLQFCAGRPNEMLPPFHVVPIVFKAVGGNHDSTAHPASGLVDFCPQKRPYLPPSSHLQNFPLISEFGFPSPSFTCCVHDKVPKYKRSDPNRAIKKQILHQLFPI